MITAAEARKKSIESEKNIEKSPALMAADIAIRGAMDRGEFSVKIFNDYLSNREKGYLEKMGFKVEIFFEDRPCGLYCTKISW